MGTHILSQHLEEVKSLHVATEKRIVEMDAGNQQLLEKLLGVEKDLDGKLQGVNENANSLDTKLTSLDNDTKNNSQTIVNLQESIFIQTEQVQKVDAERQQAEAKAKEDIASTVSTNGKAIADLKSELEDAITKIEITLKQEQTKDNSALLDRLNIVQDSTTSSEGRIDSLEKAGPEATKNLVLEIDNKLKGYDESASQKLREAEDNIQKNGQDIASHSNLLREHTENINTFISTNATFTNQFLTLETKSEDFLKYLQVERQRIDNVESELNNLDETVKKAQPEIKRNTERIDDLNLSTNLAEKSMTGIHSHIEIFESRYIETLTKITEISVLTNTLQTQMNLQEKNMLEQSADELIKIKEQLDTFTSQLHDIDINANLLASQIVSVDNGNKSAIGDIERLKQSSVVQEEFVSNLSQSTLSSLNKNDQAINDLKSELETALSNLETSLKEKASEENSLIHDKLKSMDDTDTSMSSHITNLQSKSTFETEKLVQLESMITLSTSDIKSLTEKSNRYSQYMQAIEVLEDKINNLDEIQDRNEAKIRIEISESISKNSQELKSYIETRFVNFESDRKIEHVSIRKDADVLLKQMEDFKAQHRDFESKFVDINTIQQNYDSQFQYINESAFIQNEDTFITKLNIIEEESRNNLEKIIAMEEVAMIQAEKAKYVESLTSRVNQIDEMRQQSEAKAKEDFDNTVSKNAKEIQDLKLNLEQTMIQIEHYMKEENTA